LLIVAVFASSASQAHAESNRGGVARISIGAGMRSWTVYAPSGRPVTWHPRQSDGRWWPSS
jgi:hypothetical protein